jgi:hypothetical protein
MTAGVHDVRDYTGSVTFERDGHQPYVRRVDIAIFEDEPSPELIRLIANAKIALGLTDGGRR